MNFLTVPKNNMMPLPTSNLTSVGSLNNISNDNESVISFEDLKLECKIKPTLMQSAVNLLEKKPQMTTTKIILNGLTGYLPTGLNAILGSSGAGKTSFLNALARRIGNTKDVTLTGSVKANQVEYTYKDFNKFAGYVMQDDYLLPTLTVREYIQFAADMKLPNNESEKKKRVNNILRQLNLIKCQDARIGDQLNKGISGGERKRVSIGIELISEPNVLFLDEPTSGLDSFTSYQLMSTLKSLAERENRTIVFTIHSPSTDIWNLFDRILLMVQGQFVYQGPREDILNQFNSIGYQCPVYSNPADYLMQQMNPVNVLTVRTLKHEYILKLSDKVEKEATEIIKADTLPVTLVSLDGGETKVEIHNAVSTKNKIQYLLKRQFRNILRNRVMVVTRLMQSCVMALFLSSLYWNMQRNDSDYLTIFQFAKILYITQLGSFFQSMNPQVLSFAIERPVFLKEESGMMYTTLQYFISKFIPELIVCSLSPIVTSMTFYWLCGLRADPEAFFFYLMMMIIQSNIGNAFGVFAGSLIKQVKILSSFSITFMVPQLLFGGILKNRLDFPNWIGWFQYITPSMYAVNATVVNEFEDSLFNPAELLGFTLNKWMCVGILFVLGFAINIFAYFALLAKRTKLQ